MAHGTPQAENQLRRQPDCHSPDKKQNIPMNTLKELFLDELADMYDSEHRIIQALPKLIKAATCTDLQHALQHHLQETEFDLR
jgi:hypothetical protein